MLVLPIAVVLVRGRVGFVGRGRWAPVEREAVRCRWKILRALVFCAVWMGEFSAVIIQGFWWVFMGLVWVSCIARRRPLDVWVKWDFCTQDLWASIQYLYNDIYLGTCCYLFGRFLTISLLNIASFRLLRIALNYYWEFFYTDWTHPLRRKHRSITKSGVISYTAAEFLHHAKNYSVYEFTPKIRCFVFVRDGLAAR